MYISNTSNTSNNMTTTYFSNFDNSSFNVNKPREFNKLIDDGCDIQQRNYSNDKKLKFVTTTYRDLIDAKKKLNYFGVDIKDQLFTPDYLMDDESKLWLGVTGGRLTNCNVRHEFGELPLPTMPSRYQLYHGDVSTEDNIRNYYEPNKNSCNPRDSEYYKRSFYLFEGIEVPEAMKSVEDNLRCGISSRYPPGKSKAHSNPVPGNTGTVTGTVTQGISSEVASVKVGKNYKTPVDMMNIKPARFECNVFQYSNKC